MWKQDLGLDLARTLVKREREQNLEYDHTKRESSGELTPGFSSPLLFQHPNIQFRHQLEHRGGGRGYFATGDIEPGDLVLCEAPGADIPPHPFERDPSERCLLHLANEFSGIPLEESKEFLKNLSLLHPQTLQDISPERLQTLRENYAKLLEEMQTLPRAGELGLNQEAVLLRHVCALHFNGFTTGVYLHLAMVNHSCAPNCIKWGARDGVEHSEVRATRAIKRGEEITFSYLVPLLRSRGARQRALQGQFGFECTCTLCAITTGTSTTGYEELETGSEEAKNELELLLEEVESRGELETDARAVFMRVSKARNAAKLTGGLGPRSLALAHADVVIIEACLILLEDGAAPTKARKEMQFFIMALLTKAFSVRKTQLLLFEACGAQGKETNSESETTLQHITSGLGFFINLLSGGVQILTSFKSDEDEGGGGGGRALFETKLDAVQCQNACIRASRAIALLYSYHSVQ